MSDQMPQNLDASKTLFDPKELYVTNQVIKAYIKEPNIVFYDIGGLLIKIGLYPGQPQNIYFSIKFAEDFIQSHGDVHLQASLISNRIKTIYNDSLYADIIHKQRQTIDKEIFFATPASMRDQSLFINLIVDGMPILILVEPVADYDPYSPDSIAFLVSYANPELTSKYLQIMEIIGQSTAIEAEAKIIQMAISDSLGPGQTYAASHINNIYNNINFYRAMAKLAGNREIEISDKGNIKLDDFLSPVIKELFSAIDSIFGIEELRELLEKSKNIVTKVRTKVGDIDQTNKIASVSDISERKRIEDRIEALKDDKERFLNFLSTISGSNPQTYVDFTNLEKQLLIPTLEDFIEEIYFAHHLPMINNFKDSHFINTVRQMFLKLWGWKAKNNESMKSLNLPGDLQISVPSNMHSKLKWFIRQFSSEIESLLKLRDIYRDLVGLDEIESGYETDRLEINEEDGVLTDPKDLEQLQRLQGKFEG